MKSIIRNAVLLTLMLALAQPALAQRGRKAAAEAAAARGEMLAQTCFACHGTQGASRAEAVPNIGGQYATYLNASMMRFKKADRPSSVMTRLAKGYTDDEIKAMARYISQLPFKRPPQEIDPAKVALGKAPYEKICAECHLNGGRESELGDYPLIAGQRLLYLQMQMYEIHETGKRSVDAKFFTQLERLSKEEIDAVLHYFAAQDKD